MKTNLTWKTLSVATALVLAGAPRVMLAQSSSDLDKLNATVKTMEQNIQELKQKIAELEKQAAVAAAPAAPAPAAVAAAAPPAADPTQAGLADEKTLIPNQDAVSDDQSSAPRPGNAPLDPSYKGFFQVPGTKTWMKFGGYAKLDMIADTTKVGNPNSFITSKIPVQGETDYGKDGHFAMHAKQTRMSVELRSPTDVGSLKIYYENDFFANSDQPSMDYRLRHFYGQVANLTIGQTWSTFYDPDANPDTLDFEGPGVLPVMRTQQIRYTVPLIPDAMSLAFAAEQPKSDIYNIPSGGDGKNSIPDLVAQWRISNAVGHVQAAAVVRSLAYDNATGPTDSATGWGTNLSGAVKTWGEDSAMASVSYGLGMGRYVQDLPSNNAAVVDSAGHLETMATYGFMVAYRHAWNATLRSTMSYGYVVLDNRTQMGDYAYDNTTYFQTNLIWAPTKNMYVGAEYMYGSKETRNGHTGDNHRVQLSFQYKLFR